MAMDATGWSGARTSADHTSLLVAFTGGPPYDRLDPCTVDYKGEADETATSVRIRLFSAQPPPPDTEYGCTDVGYERQVTVALTRPLGTRTVEAGGELRGVFDGALLAEPGWLPDGYVLSREGSGYPSPQTSQSWTRRWDAAAPTGTPGQCASGGPQALELTQGRGDLTQWMPVVNDEITEELLINGSPAAYRVNTQTATSFNTLSWTRADQAFVLMSSARCLGDPPPTKETMVRFAESLPVNQSQPGPPPPDSADALGVVVGDSAVAALAVGDRRRVLLATGVLPHLTFSVPSAGVDADGTSHVEIQWLFSITLSGRPDLSGPAVLEDGTTVASNWTLYIAGIPPAFVHPPPTELVPLWSSGELEFGTTPPGTSAPDACGDPEQAATRTTTVVVQELGRVIAEIVLSPGVGSCVDGMSMGASAFVELLTGLAACDIGGGVPATCAPLPRPSDEQIGAAVQVLDPSGTGY